VALADPRQVTKSNGMGAARNEDETRLDDDEEELCSRNKRIGPKVLKQLCKEQHLYSTAELNDKLYLHYRGFTRIEGLEAWTGLRALWLEGNGFDQIEGLDTMSQLRCLYIHQNCLKRIQGLNHTPLLASLQISNNFIPRIENLSGLQHLSTLQISNNALTTADDLRHLLECPSLAVLDVQNNKLEEPEVIDIFEAMPQLAVLQCQGNPFIPMVTSYRKTVVSRCKTLTYLDDRPVFEEERMATEAWAVGGLPAEREERRRQRKVKDEAHRRNLEYMKILQNRGAEEAAARRASAGEDDEEPVAPAPAPAAPPLDEPSEKEIYDRALKALEAKKRELLEKKKVAAAAEATAAAAAAAAVPASADGESDASSAAIVGGEEDGVDFQPSPTFAGARGGYAFKRGARGQGYYSEGPLVRGGSAQPQFIDKSEEQLMPGMGKQATEDAAAPEPAKVAPPSAANLDELD